MTAASYVGATSSPVGPVESWPVVECRGERWHVSPIYLAPVARVDVIEACDAWECDLPSRDLVDAIWRAAAIRVNPWKLTRPNTVGQGQTWAAYVDQRARIEALVRSEAYARGIAPEGALVAGTHKDMALVREGRIDLYGWHQLDGDPIEHGATSHDERYVDYSQGLRLVRRVGDTRPIKLETFRPPRAIAVP